MLPRPFPSVFLCFDQPADLLAAEPLLGIFFIRRAVRRSRICHNLLFHAPVCRCQCGRARGLRSGLFLIVRTVLHIDQTDIALILLRLLILQPKDTVRAGKRHDDGVHLHRDLVDRHREAPVEGQERGERADRESDVCIQRQNTAHDGAQHIADIAELCIDRTQDVGIRVCLIGRLVQLLIERIEFCDRFLLMIEDLDDLLPGHRLLDEAVQLSELLLLRDKIPSGHLRREHGAHHHHHYHGDRQYRQRNRQNQHLDQNGHHRDGAVDELRDRLADHLPQRIDIIGINRHDIAVGMRVKIPDRQLFHMLEQRIAELLH